MRIVHAGFPRLQLIKKVVKRHSVTVRRNLRGLRNIVVNAAPDEQSAAFLFDGHRAYAIHRHLRDPTERADRVLFALEVEMELLAHHGRRGVLLSHANRCRKRTEAFRPIERCAVIGGVVD